MSNRPRGIRPARPCPWTDRSTWCRKEARTSRPAGRSRRWHSIPARRRSADQRSPNSSAPAATPRPRVGRRRLRRGSRSARRPRLVSPRSGILPVAAAAPPPRAEECPVAKRSSGSISRRAGRLPLLRTSRCVRPHRRAAPPPEVPVTAGRSDSPWCRSVRKRRLRARTGRRRGPPAPGPSDPRRSSRRLPPPAPSPPACPE